ncbi:MAG: 50S ribosomal protein L10 [Candidatus Micrarchaeota archaeon]|nr:50S ribosomal protein L10 [Candidatus Micrarchaeota archaeon]
MALTKSGKVKFVEDAKKELKSYKVVGILNLNGLPDRLTQKAKNSSKPNTRFILGRKTLLQKILEAHPKGGELVKNLTGTSAIILSNDDPFELYGRFKKNAIKLSAKPGQVAPSDVHIQSGETNIMPGQTVTELKGAGIDVQIQKGKVVIAKDKILVKKGETITLGVAKALHTLEIYPFSAVVDPVMMADNGMLYSRAVLGIDQERVLAMMTGAFRSALAISLDRNIINSYTIVNLIGKAYNNAMYLGIEAKIPDSGIIERVMANAVLGAQSLNSMVKPPEAAAPAAEAPKT